MIGRLTGCLALCAVLLSGAPATATTVVSLPFEVLSRAPLVVRGVVASVATHSIDRAPGVVTDYTVVVAENLTHAGIDNVEVLTVRIPGGRSDTHAVFVEGMPELVVGEQIVLFLEPLPLPGEPTFIPFGLNQGVWRQADSGFWAPTVQEGVLGDAPPADPMSLSDLRRAVLAGSLEAVPAVCP